MYEDLPYPPRDPADEAPGEPFALDAPSTPAAIAQHAYGGGLDFATLRRPFRILIAGGGTGDATVMAAVTFHMAQIPVEIVQVDLSAASIDVAKRRLEIHALPPEGVNVTFVQGSFLELRAEDLGGLFDFVNSVGVVHHLASPAAGLRALRAMLQPDGGLFLMVYGALGRTGVYDVQDMWRLSGVSRRELLAGPLQALLQALPATNRLAMNRRMLSRRVKEGDLSTLSDLLAHHCDHAYTVASLMELLAEAGLELLAFADPGKYDVPADIASALEPLTAGLEDPWELAHFVELLKGDIFVHAFWAAPAAASADAAAGAAGVGGRSRKRPLVSSDMALCPVWRLVGYRLLLREEDRSVCFDEGAKAAAAEAAGTRRVPTTCALYIDSVEYAGLPCAAVPLLERLDCATTAGTLSESLLEELRGRLSGVEASGLTTASALSLVSGLYGALLRAPTAQQQVFLVRPALRLRREPWREKRVPRVVLRRDWDALTAPAEGVEAEEDSSSDDGESSEL